jgi:hypothetical protein
MGARVIMQSISWEKMLRHACQAACQPQPSIVTRLRVECLENRRIAGGPPGPAVLGNGEPSQRGQEKEALGRGRRLCPRAAFLHLLAPGG